MINPCPPVVQAGGRGHNPTKVSNNSHHRHLHHIRWRCPTTQHKEQQVSTEVHTAVIYDGSPESLQRYFDVTVQHLFQLKERAVGSHDNCMYLTPDGRKCAVGIHIPNGHPSQQTDGGVFTLIDEYPDLIGIAVPSGLHGADLADDLQQCHDNRLHWNENGLNMSGREELQHIANKYDLSPAVLDRG